MNRPPNQTQGIGKTNYRKHRRELQRKTSAKNTTYIHGNNNHTYYVIRIRRSDDKQIQKYYRKYKTTNQSAD